MNERIKELAEQAGWMMGDEVEGFNTRLEKFALLIIRECIEVIKDSEGSSQYFPHVTENIEKHFGVEETKGWVCPKCGTDRIKAACPLGHSAALEGKCPMVGVAQ